MTDESRPTACRWRGAVTWALLLVLPIAVAVAGCAKATPTCDEASGLVGTGRLGQAAAAYALARERGEGDCADAGLVNVKNRYGDAYVEVAKGRVAEEAKDVPGAITANRAALAIDADNPAAKEALTRLQQPIPTLLPPPSAPQAPVSAAPPAVPPLVTALMVAALTLLVAVLALLGWAVWRWRGWTEQQRQERSALQSSLGAVRLQATTSDTDLRSKLAGVEQGVKDSEKGVKKAVEELATGLGQHGQALADMRTSVRDLRAELDGVPEKTSAAVSRRVGELEQHLDDVVDAITDIVADVGRPSVQRFVRPDQ